ncbi:MAG: hypothetical protein JSW07_21775 [bacterium]|nr:MAG: hypothetical protein JSW07_21775 [bacterium]
MYQLVGEELRKLDREHLLAIYLNRSNKVIDIEVLVIGALSEVPALNRDYADFMVRRDM